MVNFISVLSRYYFAFLIVCYVIICMSYIYRLVRHRIEPGNCKNLLVINILFLVFAIVILGFYDDMRTFNAQSLLFGLYSLVFVFVGAFFVFRFFKNASRILTYSMFFLLSIGFVMLYRLNPNLAMQQLIFASMGLVASIFIPLIMKIFHSYEKLEYLYIIICISLIGMVSIASVVGGILNIPLVTVGQFGADNWISVFGIGFQPSEFAKPIFILYLASAFRIKPSLKKIIITSSLSAILIFILVYQRDLGGALMFFVVYITMLYIATGSKRLVLAGFGAMGIASVVAYHLFAHVRVRVLAWQSPFIYILTEGWQISQSLFAIATFGAFGAGLGRGLPAAIPVVERDVIFSAFIEEFGWIFGIMVIFIYAIILIYGMYIAIKAKRPFYSLLAAGFTVFIAFQAFVAIAGNIRLIPMTGITLPFMSYGGSSVFVSIIMLGMVNWLNSVVDGVEKK